MLLAILNLPLFSTALVSATSLNSSVQNPEALTLADGTVLAKKVEPVPGFLNKWRVTLRVEAKKNTVSSDTVLVIDRSSSMKGDRMTVAKQEANSLIDKLLSDGNTANRVAVVSFADLTKIDADFTSNKAVAKAAVNQLVAYGGTFTQSAIRLAVNLIEKSTANLKNIVFLSDGEPTYSYEINNPDNYLSSQYIIEASPGSFLSPAPGVHLVDGHRMATTADVPGSDFVYDRVVGTGAAMFHRYYNAWFSNEKDKYYNHGNSAIAEAGFYKKAGIGNLYTIALLAGDFGNVVLQQMATPGKAYTASLEDLATIFDEIGGQITSSVQDAVVEDVMGDGVVVVGSDAGAIISNAGKKLTWNIGIPNQLVGEKYIAELSYEIELDENIATAANDAGFYAANKEAKITYNSVQNGAQSGIFPVPKLKPSFIYLKKELIGDDCANCKFKVELRSGHDVISREILANSVDNVLIYEALQADATYTISETAARDADGKVLSLAQYETTIEPTAALASQLVGRTIVLTNRLKTRSVKVRKIWDGKPGNEVEVRLLADGNDINKSVKLNANNNWQHEFTSLRLINKYSGQAINYTLNETPLAGYATSYSQDNDGTLLVINQYKIEKISVTAKKEWLGGSNYNGGVRPTIQFQLKKNGVNEGAPVTLTNNVTETTWTNLDKTDKFGVEHKYSVTELDLPVGEPYQKTQKDDLTIVNTYVSPKIDVTVSKQWQGGLAILPPAISVNIYRQTAGRSKELVLNKVEINGLVDNWTKTWSLPKTDNEGNEYQYVVEEVPVFNFDTTYNGLLIVNTYQIPSDSIRASKTWIGGPNVKPRIWFKLYRNINNSAPEAVPGADIKEVSGSSVVWDTIQKTDTNGNAYNFSVREVDASGNDFTPVNYEKLESGLRVTNTYKQPMTEGEIIAQKVWQGGEKYNNGIRPKVQFELWRKNGAAGTGELVVAAQDLVGNQVNFGQQLKTDINGVVYDYYAVEAAVPEHYQASGVGLIITNKFIIPTDDIKVTKKWQGGSTILPHSLKVQLYRQLSGGKKEKLGLPVELSALNRWQHTWSGQALTDDFGNQYTFSVEEEFLERFELVGGQNQHHNHSLILLNRYISPKLDLVINKIWEDDFSNHPEVEVAIDRNGVQVALAKLNADNAWSYTVQVEATDSEANAYTYTVREITQLPHYQTKLKTLFLPEDGVIKFMLTNCHQQPLAPDTGTGADDLVTLLIASLCLMLGLTGYFVLNKSRANQA